MYSTRTNSFDSLLNEVFPYMGKQTVEYMKTDIKKEGDNYVMEIDLPGVIKEDISLSLEKGYLTVIVKANKTTENEYIIRERVSGEYGRRYYVGNDITEEDVKAAFTNGVLTLTFPIEKKVEKKSIYID